MRLEGLLGGGHGLELHHVRVDRVAVDVVAAALDVCEAVAAEELQHLGHAICGDDALGVVGKRREEHGASLVRRGGAPGFFVGGGAWGPRPLHYSG